MDDIQTMRPDAMTSSAGDVWREHAPYVACGVAALILRVPALDRLPLSVTEAASSWAAWSVATGGASVLPLLERPPESAALFAFQCALFWLIGGSDYVARLAPALVGAAVVGVPWMLRLSLGRTASVALAVLVTCDPLLVGYARLADGAAFASTASWVLIAGLIVLADSPALAPRARAAWLGGMAVAAGVAGVSGPLAWDLLPPLIVGACVLASQEDGVPGFTARHAALAASTALLVATSGLIQWEGPSLVSASVGGWLRQWVLPDGRSLAETWVAILRHEMLPLTLGLGGLIVAWSRRRSPFLVAWLLWGCLLTLRPGRSAAAWIVIGPPLLLMASQAVGWLAESWRASATSLAAIPSRIAVAAAVILLAQFVHVSFDVSGGRYATGFRPYTARTEPAVRFLAEDVARMQRRSATVDRLPVEVVTQAGVDPVLGWYLRREPMLRWVSASSPPSSGTRQLIVEPEGPGVDGRTGVYGIRRTGAALERVRLR